MFPYAAAHLDDFLAADAFDNKRDALFAEVLAVHRQLLQTNGAVYASQCG
jgi:hypothetical protein